MLHCSFSLAAAQLLVKITSALHKSQCCSATSQKHSGDPNPQYFSKSTAVQMGGVLPYKWEAYCSTNRRRIAGFPFLRSLEARKVQHYKWGAYCRTNWRRTAVLFRQAVGVGVSETLPNFCSAAFRKLQRNFRFRLWHVTGLSAPKSRDSLRLRRRFSPLSKKSRDFLRPQDARFPLRRKSLANRDFFCEGNGQKWSSLRNSLRYPRLR